MIVSGLSKLGTKGVSELEPVQNYQTGPVRPVQILDRSGPAGDRPVHKAFETGKNRQQLIGSLGRLLTVKERGLKKTSFRDHCSSFVNLQDEI